MTYDEFIRLWVTWDEAEKMKQASEYPEFYWRYVSRNRLTVVKDPDSIWELRRRKMGRVRLAWQVSRELSDRILGRR